MSVGISMDEIFVGKINVYDDEKCFGFIRRLKGRDIFFSIDDINGFDLSIHSISLNQDVSFKISKIKNKVKATSITLL